MADEKVRLGGMALANGVLVHGPTAWACAIRTEDGDVRVAARHKRFRAAELETPLLRGPARLLEAMAVLPEIRRALPEARLPFQRPVVLATMLSSAVAVRLVRGSAASARRRRSSSAACSRSPRPRSRCVARTSPATTARSTSRSAATSTTRPARRNTSAAAPT